MLVRWEIPVKSPVKTAWGIRWPYSKFEINEVFVNVWMNLEGRFYYPFQGPLEAQFRGSIRGSVHWSIRKSMRRSIRES